MVSGRSVTGLKSAIYFLNSHGTNDQTARRGKNLKKGKHTDRDMVPGLNCMFLFFLIFASPGSLIIRSMANQKQKKCTY